MRALALSGRQFTRVALAHRSAARLRGRAFAASRTAIAVGLLMSACRACVLRSRSLALAAAGGLSAAASSALARCRTLHAIGRTCRSASPTLSVAVVLAAGAALIATLSLEARFHWVRARVLAADPAQLGNARPAFRGRLSRRGRDRTAHRAARHRAASSSGAQCRRAFRRRHPRANRGAAGYAPAPGIAAAPGRDRPGGRRGLTAVAAAAAAAAALRSWQRRTPARPEARPRRTTTDWRRVARSRALGDQFEFRAGRRPQPRNLVNPDDRYTRIHDRAISDDPAHRDRGGPTYCRGCRRPACAAR